MLRRFLRSPRRRYPGGPATQGKLVKFFTRCGIPRVPGIRGLQAPAGLAPPSRVARSLPGPWAEKQRPARLKKNRAGHLGVGGWIRLSGAAVKWSCRSWGLGSWHGSLRSEGGLGGNAERRSVLVGAGFGACLHPPDDPACGLCSRLRRKLSPCTQPLSLPCRAAPVRKRSISEPADCKELRASILCRFPKHRTE